MEGVRVVGGGAGVLAEDVAPERVWAGVGRGVDGEGEAVAAVVHDVHCLVEGGDVEGLGGWCVVDVVEVVGGRVGGLGDGEGEAPEGVAAFGVEVCCCYFLWLWVCLVLLLVVVVVVVGIYLVE